MIDTLKLIVGRSERASHLALQAIKAARADSPVLQARYNQVAEVALLDPSADWTPAERQQIAAHLGAGDAPAARSTTIQVRVTLDEKADIETRAAAAGQTISDYLRTLLFDQEPRP